MILIRCGNNMFPTFKKIFIDIKKLCLNMLNNPKTISDYCLRIILFLLLNRYCIYNFLLNLIYIPLFKLFPIDTTSPGNLDGIFVLFAMITYTYILAITCGLFKKIHNLNIFTGILILFFVEILRGYFYGLQIQLLPLKFSYHEPVFIFILPFLFLIDKKIFKQ